MSDRSFSHSNPEKTRAGSVTLQYVRKSNFHFTSNLFLNVSPYFLFLNALIVTSVRFLPYLFGGLAVYSSKILGKLQNWHKHRLVIPCKPIFDMIEVWIDMCENFTGYRGIEMQ